MTGFVYAIRMQSEHGFIKIGFTRDIRDRLDKLQTDSPYPLELLACTPGTMKLERGFHKRLEEHRERGEWFRPSPKVLAVVEVLRGLPQELPAAAGRARLTATEREDIARWLGDGDSQASVARRVGVSQPTIQKIRAASGLPPKARSKLTPEQRGEIVLLLEQGVSGAELSRRYQVNPVTISHIKKRFLAST